MSAISHFERGLALSADWTLRGRQELDDGRQVQARVVFESVCDFRAWPAVGIGVLDGAHDRFFPVVLQRRVAGDRLDVEADELPGAHLQPWRMLVTDYLLQTTRGT